MIKYIFGCAVIVFVAMVVDRFLLNGESSSACINSSYKFAVKHMATKSPYIHPEDRECGVADNCAHLNPNHISALTVPEGCKAEQIWMLIRHGSRNPSAGVISKMLKLLLPLKAEILQNHQNNKGELCDEEISALTDWEPFPELTESAEKKLVFQGELEILRIGKRFKKKFPELFTRPFKNETYKFKYTKTQRAEASAKSFAESIFGKVGAQDVWYPEAVVADPVLRFYKGCPKWKRDVDKNPDAYKERVKFEESEPFVNILKSLKLRNGFERDLSLDEVNTIYLACSFETAWNPNIVSPWCGFFDENAFTMMEYRQDIEYYWIDGYGFELNYKQACPAIKDIITHLEQKINNPQDVQSVIAYFTHSGTILKLLARLGLYNDSEELRSDNFQKHLHNRKWRTSVIDKFASNLAFVLYKCPTSYNVGVLYQEQPIRLPACKGEWMCTFEEFNAALAPLINDCDMNQMCKI